jgi:polar amino acid transport system substrate-binding protein
MKLSMAVVALLGALASPAWSATVTLRADTWCPFNCEPKGNPSGYVIEIAEYALAKKGHKIDYATMPWARTLQETVAGNVDGAVAAGETEVTDNKLIVGKETIGIGVDCVYTKSSRSEIYRRAADLKNFKKIGTVKDYVYGDEFAAVLKAAPQKYSWADSGTGSFPSL